MRSNFFPLPLARSSFFTRCMEFQQQDITRRTFVKALVGLAMAGAGGGFVACSSIPQGVKLFSYAGHIHSVYAVAWSPDGLHIASGGDDKTVQVWNALSGTLESTYPHPNVVTSVAWSPDSSLIASGCDDQMVRVWSIEKGNLAWDPYKANAYVGKVQVLGIWGLTWSPDGNRIASAAGELVQVWDAKSKKPTLEYPGHSDHRVWDLSWSPDGLHIASGGDDKTIQVWNAENGYKTVTCKLHKSSVRGIAWSLPDGRYIASGGLDNKMFVWESETGQFVFSGSHDDDVYGVSWSQDGIYVTSSSRDRLVKVWDFNKRINALLYDGRSGTVYCTVWSPESKRLASGYRDNTVQVWELPNI